MNTVVSQLLDIDKQASRIIDEAQQYYDQTIGQLASEKENLLLRYKQKCQAHLNEVRETERANIEDASWKTKQELDQKMKQLENHFTKHHATWEDTLFQRCIGR